MKAILTLAAVIGSTVGSHARPPVLGPPVPMVPAPVVAAVPTPTATPPATATPSPAPTVTPTPAATLPPVSTRAVSVAGVEFAFTLSQTAVDAGDVRVQLDLSRAEDPHQLVIINGGALAYDSGKRDPGSVTRETVRLTPGTYALLCPLPEHEARGMTARLTVK